MEPQECPMCGTDLSVSYEDNGQALLGSRLIGVEVQGVYDGVLFWVCPDCDVAFHRFTEGRYHHMAQPHIDQHNLTTLKRKG